MSARRNKGLRSSRRYFAGSALSGLAALALVGTPRRAWAAEVEVNVSLGRPQLEVGRSAYLQVEIVTAGRSSVSEPQIKGLEGVEVFSRGSSSGMSIQIINNRRTSRATKTFTYVVTPLRAGEYEIEVEVEVDGQTYPGSSKPKLIVTGEDYVPTVERAKAGDQPTDPSAEVIVWPVVDKAEAYIGEQIVYEMQVWTRSRGNLNITSAPTFKDFWSEDLLTAAQQRRLGAQRRFIDNVPFQVHRSLRRALFPQKAGTLTIGGPEVQQQALSSPFFGGGGPPQSFFGRSLAIEVKPLPAEEQPPNFPPNNVGQLRISSSVDRTELRQGEAVRLTVEISGTGNLALVELPELPELPGLRAYEPKPEPPRYAANTQRIEGSRVFTMLLIADQAGTVEIPMLELPFFEPKNARYLTARSKPITLEIEENPNAAPPPAQDEAEAEGQTKANEGSAADLTDDVLAPAFAGGELPRVTPREPWLTRGRWWAGSLAVPALLGLGALGLRMRERYGPSEEARARATELARRRGLLSEAKANAEGGEGFYPKLGELLQSAAVWRAGPEGVGLTRGRLMELLAGREVPSEEVDELRELLDACDAARYGAGAGDVNTRRAHLERAEALLAKRSWRGG